MKNIWIFMCLILLAAVGYSGYRLIQKRTITASLIEQRDELTKQLNTFQNELELREKLTEADELLLAGKYDSALSAYHLLSGEGLDQQVLDVRHQAIDQYAMLMKELENKDHQAYQRMLEIKEGMAEQLDLVRSKGELEKDSIITRLSSEISSLKEKLASENSRNNAKADVDNLVFYSKSGTRTTYFGEVKHGKANGRGMGHYVTGNIYIGDWKDNYRHGDGGKFLWLSGERYEGQYAGDRREGKGTYYWSNGEKYEGQWSADMQNGIGILYDRDGNVKLKGEWKNGELVREIN